jgi:hypothetical protein
MRTMNDDLMVRIAINQALLSSVVIGLLKFRAQVSSIYMPKVNPVPTRLCHVIHYHDAKIYPSILNQNKVKMLNIRVTHTCGSYKLDSQNLIQFLIHSFLPESIIQADQT